MPALAVLCLALTTLSVAATENKPQTRELHDPAEAGLAAGLEMLRNGQLNDALQQLDTLIEKHPTFQLAHAVRADVMAQLVGQQSVFDVPADGMSALAEEARQRFAGQRNIAQSLDRVPANLLELGPHTDTLVMVDLTANRLYLYSHRAGQLRLDGDHYVTIGKSGTGKEREGDNRTPIGLYRIQPFLPDEELPELYGHGALPLDYPNAWDKFHGRTGYGIWIHGQPRDSYARPPRDSMGCVVISNRVMPSLNAWSTAGATPVIMVDSINWVDQNTLTSMRQDLHDTLEVWRRSWSEGDMDRFMSLHDAQFRNDQLTRGGFEKRKRQIARRNATINIDISDREMLMFEDIDGTPVAEVRFKQHYRSSRYEDKSVKTQYWALRKGAWRLTLETERVTPRPRNTPVQTVEANALPREATDPPARNRAIPGSR